MQKKIAQSAIAVTLAALVSGGCASTRFSAPEVNLDDHVSRKTVRSSCAKSKSNEESKIEEDFNGAMQLIDNFLVGYRCAAQSAAEGRTKFEVPTFLLATTAAVGQSFGISEDWTLGLATGAAVTRQGNSYFAPQAKADYLNSAVDALTCIQLESVGIDGFDLSQTPAAAPAADSDPKFLSKNVAEAIPEKSEKLKEVSPTAVLTQSDLEKLGYDQKEIGRVSTISSSEGIIKFPAEQQYFRMISGALLSVERVLARRLNHAGTPFDPAGIVAEISMLSQDQGMTENMEPGDEMAKEKMLEKKKLNARKLELMGKSNLNANERLELKFISERLVTIKIKEIQPKLQKCIILAKI